MKICSGMLNRGSKCEADMKRLDKKPQVSGGLKFIFARLAVLYRDLRMEWRGAKASFASKKLSAPESHEVSAAPFQLTVPGRAICNRLFGGENNEAQKHSGDPYHLSCRFTSPLSF